MQVQPWGMGRSLEEERGNPLQCRLPGTRSLAGWSQGCKEWMRLQSDLATHTRTRECASSVVYKNVCCSGT